MSSRTLYSDNVSTEDSTMDSLKLSEALQRLNLEAILSLVFHPSDKRNITDDVDVSIDEQVRRTVDSLLANVKQQSCSETTLGTARLETLTLFVSGDKSSVGKSSICLAILASLVRLGADPSTIAYIKVSTVAHTALVVDSQS